MPGQGNSPGTRTLYRALPVWERRHHHVRAAECPRSCAELQLHRQRLGRGSVTTCSTGTSTTSSTPGHARGLRQLLCRAGYEARECALVQMRRVPVQQGPQARSGRALPRRPRDGARA